MGREVVASPRVLGLSVAHARTAAVLFVRAGGSEQGGVADIRRSEPVFGNGVRVPRSFVTKGTG